MAREKETEQRVILPLNLIRCVVELANGDCFIETAVNNDGSSIGTYLKEKFDEIMSILSKIYLSKKQAKRIKLFSKNNYNSK